jgi:dihydrofolate reductase
VDVRVWDSEQEDFKHDELAAADALLLGRVTYEGFAAAWPSAPEEEEPEQMNGIRKHVASATLEEPLEWENSTLLEGDVAEGVSRLKQQDGKDILVYGSATLVGALMEHDLVDEYKLMVFPVVVGSGRKLFEGSVENKPLKLVDTQTFPTGVVVLTYEPQREEGASHGE